MSLQASSNLYQPKEIISLGNYRARSGFYTIELATLEEFEGMQFAHDNAYAALSAEMKSFINPRPYNDRIETMAKGGYALIVRDGLSQAIIGGALAARAPTVKALKEQQGAAEVKLYEEPVFFDALTIQNVFLNQSFHGNGICAGLFDAVAELAEKSDADLVCFGVNEDNQIAIHSALKAGYKIYGQGIYTKLGVNIWMFSRRVSSGHIPQSQAA